MMQTTVKLMTALLLLLLSNSIQAEQKPWEHGRLQVSDNQRFLQHADGTPFFWLEVSYYLDKARDAGYNMIQVQVLNDVPSINAYGQPSHDQQGNLLTKADYGYWDHMDYIVSQAEQRGIYIGMVCIWGGVVKAGKLSVEQAKTYGCFLANRYKNHPNIIWIIGGDIQGDIKADVWETLALYIRQMVESGSVDRLPHLPEWASQVRSAHERQDLSHTRQYGRGQLDVCGFHLGLQTHETCH